MVSESGIERNTSGRSWSSIPGATSLGEDVHVLTFKIHRWSIFGNGPEEIAAPKTQWRSGLIGVFTSLDGAKFLGDRWLDIKQSTFQALQNQTLMLMGLGQGRNGRKSVTRPQGP